MQVAFRMEEKLAEIHLIPTTPLNKSQLQMIRQYGDKKMRITVGQESELIVVIEMNGDSNAADEKAKA